MAAREDTSAGETGNKDEKLKIAFVYVGPVGDGGWTYAHDQARQEMEKVLDFVETTYIEDVPESSDAKEFLRNYVKRDIKLFSLQLIIWEL